jgi:hypothetical protein
LGVDQLPGAADPLRIRLDVEKVEARVIRERDGPRLDRAGVTILAIERRRFDAGDGPAHDFTPEAELVDLRDACRCQQDSRFGIIARRGIVAGPHRFRLPAHDENLVPGPRPALRRRTRSNHRPKRLSTPNPSLRQVRPAILSRRRGLIRAMAGTSTSAISTARHGIHRARLPAARKMG